MIVVFGLYSSSARQPPFRKRPFFGRGGSKSVGHLEIFGVFVWAPERVHVAPDAGRQAPTAPRTARAPIRTGRTAPRKHKREREHKLNTGRKPETQQSC